MNSTFEQRREREGNINRFVDMGSGIAKISPRYSSDTYVPNWRNEFGSSLNNRHPLYLISVRKFLELYHNKEGAKMESHRILKRRGDLAELQHISKQPVIFGMCNFKLSLSFPTRKLDKTQFPTNGMHSKNPIQRESSQNICVYF